MTDKELVERLNAYSSQYQNHGGITAEAADRIEQLHTELIKERIDNTNLIGELATVAAERDRYKAEHENLRPPTNADRIRAMSDEELAHLLMGHGTFECPVCEIGDQRKCDTECEKHCVKWLQQPAEEER